MKNYQRLSIAYKIIKTDSPFNIFVLFFTITNYTSLQNKTYSL
jgi:hypothetical protein